MSETIGHRVALNVDAHILGSHGGREGPSPSKPDLGVGGEVRIVDWLKGYTNWTSYQVRGDSPYKVESAWALGLKVQAPIEGFQPFFKVGAALERGLYSEYHYDNGDVIFYSGENFYHQDDTEIKSWRVQIEPGIQFEVNDNFSLGGSIMFNVPLVKNFPNDYESGAIKVSLSVNLF